MTRYLIALLPLLCLTAWAGKGANDIDAEIERLRTDLRLRTAELQVTRGQLRSCQKKERRAPNEEGR